MLKELSEKDNYWRIVAYKMCGCKSLADDLVQEMYLRRYENDRGQKLTDHYVISTILSIYLNRKKTNKLILVDELRTSTQSNGYFEPTDADQRLLDKASQLPFAKRELLELNYDYSLREIQKMFNINYGYTYKLTKQAREFILGKDINKYNNKRLKFRKMAKQQGLGDRVEQILEKSGVKKLVQLVAGDDCGCDKRKKWLNELPMFFNRQLKVKCFTGEQLKDYGKFIATRKLILLPEGAKGRLEGKQGGSDDEITFLCDMYAIIFNRQKWYPECRDCLGTVHTLVDMIRRLDTVYYNNLDIKESGKDK